MMDLDSLLRKAVADREAPFLVAMSGNTGGVTWSGAAGERSAGEPATVDTVFRIFSMTKAVGSTAAMILIDRGKLSMDTEVEAVLPEFKKVQVLEGIEGGKPILRAPRTKATVRHLATHTSGFVYEFWNSMIPSYMEIAGHPTIISGLNASLHYPLAFDPGERWDYGIGIDWLGKVVEAVDGRTVDRFCHEEIFGPLSMADTGFEVEGTMKSRLASVRARAEDGSFVDFELSPPSNPEFYGMGHALYSTAPDYMRFLRMYLNRGQIDGHRILSEDAVEHMLSNQIGDLRVSVMKTVAPPVTADTEFFPGREKTHSFGFMRMEEDVPGMRSEGAQSWAGVLNTHFWFDPTCDVAGLIMTQMLPFADPAFIRLYERYEAGVYANRP